MKFFIDDKFNSKNKSNLHFKNLDKKRLEEIIKVFSKYGFEFFSNKYKFGSKSKIFKIFNKNNLKSNYNFEKNFRLALEELGPTFIKFGQILSTRPDLVGENLANELENLLDRGKQIPFSKFKKTLEKDFSINFQTFFKSFNQIPIASASISQVYKAKLKNNKDVVVKIRKPDIENIIKNDIKIIKYLALKLENHIKLFNNYKPSLIVNEFERTILKELDFNREKINILRFKQYFKNDSKVYIPTVFEEFCSENVLVLEYINGTKLYNLQDFRNNKDSNNANKYKIKSKKTSEFNNKEIANNITDSFFKQIFEAGFFHADPHPANILILKNNKICLIDFGMTEHFDFDFTSNLASLFLALIDYNINGIINELTNLGILNDNVNIKNFKYDLIDLLDVYYGVTLKDFKIGNAMSMIINLLLKYKLQIPREFVFLSRALILVESINSKLNPDFNVVNQCKPYVKKVITSKLNPVKFKSLISQDLTELEHFVKTLPQTLKAISKRLKSGKINVELEHKSLDEFGLVLEKSFSKISFSLVLASLIIGFSLVLENNLGFLNKFKIHIFTIFISLGIFYLIKNLIFKK